MKMNRAYSILEVKAVDDDKRIITGIATTPTPDRMGDIVEPLGIEYTNPMPLLWQHRSSEPVGQVTFRKPTKDGVQFEARMPKVDEPGTLKDRIDEAWQSVKLGLVRAVSIGFRSLENSFMKEGGIRFIRSEVLELSLVTIPAQAEATIQTIKSIDAPLLAASGIGIEDRPKPPGVTGKTKPVRAQEGKRMAKKTIAEQISAFEATRQAKAAEMDAIMDDAAEKGETLDAEQKETFDTLEAEVREIDEHLVRLRAREVSLKAAAKPVEGSNQQAASESRSAVQPISVRRNVEKGIIFTRLLGAKYIASHSYMNPADVAKSRFPDTPEVEMILRTAVEPGTTTGTAWAAPLVALQNATNEFVELLRAATIVDRLGLRRVPFNVKIPRMTGDPAVGWVGEAGVKPVSSGAFDSVELTFNKVSGIVPMTEELMRFSSPSAETTIRDALVAAVTYLVDRDFLDPSKAVATGVSPASVTNGVTPIPSTGTDADALRADLGSLLTAFAALNVNLSGLRLVMTSQQAIRIGMLRNAFGQSEFPGIGVTGGTLEGIPVITSENIVSTGGSPADGGLIVAINANDVALADDGGVAIDISREASLQMDTSPDSPTVAGTVLVSLWQRNMVAIRAERFITWKKLRDGAVQFISYAKYA